MEFEIADRPWCYSIITGKAITATEPAQTKHDSGALNALYPNFSDINEHEKCSVHVMTYWFKLG